MFTRHTKPGPEVVQARRDRHHRQLSLLRVRAREEDAELGTLQPQPEPEEDAPCSPARELQAWLRMAR